MPIARGLTVALWFTSAALVIADGTAAQETKPTPTITIGPFRTGMTFAALRAAVPELGWQEGKSLESSYRKTLKAQGAIALAGAPYDVIATPG